MQGQILNSDDYYTLLGIRRNASADEIKSAFWGLARKYHPDVNSNSHSSSEHFKKLARGYEVLSDQEKRRKYDLMRPKLRTLEVSITLSFAQSYLGCEKTVTISLPRVNVKTAVAKNFCVRIPPGVKDGALLRVEAAMDGQIVDIALKIRVNINAAFKRVNDDVHTAAPVSISQLLLGSSVSVTIPSGELRVTIPHGSKAGDILRIKNRGFSGISPGVRGDLLVRLELKMPALISADAKQIIRHLSQILPGF